MPDASLETRPSTEELSERIELLMTEHRSLETRLLELDSHISLSPGEQVERKTIQKLKLRKKDQISALQRMLSVRD